MPLNINDYIYVQHTVKNEFRLIRKQIGLKYYHGMSST